MKKTKVLFLCTGNTARSQMAEAFLRRYAGHHFKVYSAGLEPDVINPNVVQVMEKAGYNLNDQYSKSINPLEG
jgi:arsenate reductase (thioredoxin)